MCVQCVIIWDVTERDIFTAVGTLGSSFITFSDTVPIFHLFDFFQLRLLQRVVWRHTAVLLPSAFIFFYSHSAAVFADSTSSGAHAEMNFQQHNTV